LKRQVAAVQSIPLEHGAPIAEVELYHETVGLAFELALPPAKPFYVRQLMADIAPLVEQIAQQSVCTPGEKDSRAAFYAFKRLQFVSQSYGAHGGPPDSAADRLKQQEALEQALAVWEQITGSDEAAAFAERGSSKGALLEEGAEILDSLAILRCMEKRNVEGLAMAQRGANLLEQHWGLLEALKAIRQGLMDSSPAGLELVPPATLVSLATTYRNMAVCASENEDTSAALKYYLNAALLRTDLLLAHGQAQNDKDHAIEYDESPSSQRARRQHSMGKLLLEESEEELSELVYRISNLAGKERSNGMAALESRLRTLKGSPEEKSALLSEGENAEKVEALGPQQAAKPAQAEAAAKPAVEEPPATAAQPKKKKMMKKKKKKASTAAGEL